MLLGNERHAGCCYAGWKRGSRTFPYDRIFPSRTHETEPSVNTTCLVLVWKCLNVLETQTGSDQSWCRDDAHDSFPEVHTHTDIPSASTLSADCSVDHGLAADHYKAEASYTHRRGNSYSGAKQLSAESMICFLLQLHMNNRIIHLLRCVRVEADDFWYTEKQNVFMWT